MLCVIGASIGSSRLLAADYNVREKHTALINDLPPSDSIAVTARRFEIKKYGKIIILVDIIAGHTWALERNARIKGGSYRWVSIPTAQQWPPEDRLDEKESNPFDSPKSRP